MRSSTSARSSAARAYSTCRRRITTEWTSGRACSSRFATASSACSANSDAPRMVDDVQPVVGVLLAAGRGTRFGGHKLRAMLHGDRDAGMTLGVAAGRHLLEALPASIAVVRADDSRVADDLSAIGFRVVPCTRADEGM